jgi:RNA polymerase sigma-70 factor (ECF subfamily)
VLDHDTLETWPSLLKRLRHGDDYASWECFLARYWRLIYAFARQCGLDASDAEDVVQEVVTEVFKAMPRFEYDRAQGRFRSYLRKITQRKVIDHYRRQSRRDAVSFDDLPPEAGARLDPISPAARDAWEAGWRQNLLQLWLDQVAQEVGPKTFQAFQMYALDGLSAADTARFLNMSVASVYVAKSRVIRRIQIHAAEESEVQADE